MSCWPAACRRRPRSRRIKDSAAPRRLLRPGLVLAKKLVRIGADALVIEGMEAGGHTGPVTTSVLAQEILPTIHEVPVFVAGGIGRGEAIVSYLEMGAAGVQLGTRFVCATESIAHRELQEGLHPGRSARRDLSVQLDPRFPVIPVRAIANAGTRRFTEIQREVIAKVDQGLLDQKAAQLEIEHFWAGALRRAVIDGDVENGSLMAGQSVGLVKSEQPVAEILAELIAQAETALDRRREARR
jgi:enoyl-[acyl-carrier protein] reductase II